jgi:hypothetical protein
MGKHSIRGAGGKFSPKPVTTGMFTDSLTPGLAAYGAYMMKQVHAAMRAWGADAVDRMKADAPWEDRTGDARRGLGWSLDEDMVRPTLYLFHSVRYGVYLEVRWNGRYAIVLPTMESFGPELINYIEEVI